MKDTYVREQIVSFIKEYSVYPDNMYWFPLVRLKKEIPIVAYDIDSAYSITARRAVIEYALIIN